VLHDLVISSGQVYPAVTAWPSSGAARSCTRREPGHSLRSRARCSLCAVRSSPSARSWPAQALALGHLLDKQLVDIEGHKIIRVNDIQLLRSAEIRQRGGVDVSSSALMRRVGLGKVSERLRRTRDAGKPHLIDWRDVDVAHTDESSVRLTVPRNQARAAPPGGHRRPRAPARPGGARRGHRLAGRRPRRRHRGGDAPSYQASLLLDLSDEKAGEILANMAPDDAADLLADLPEDRRKRFIAKMEKEDADDIRELLSYPEHSAGGIMTPDFRLGPAGRYGGGRHGVAARAGGHRGDHLLHLRTQSV